jgi:hypothetical protein
MSRLRSSRTDGGVDAAHSSRLAIAEQAKFLDQIPDGSFGNRAATSRCLDRLTGFVREQKCSAGRMALARLPLAAERGSASTSRTEARTPSISTVSIATTDAPCSQGQAIVRARDEGRGGPSGDDTRNNVSVHIERSRENVFTVTATSQELSALVAAARMALEAMRSAPEPPPPSAVEILERVLREFDLARERLTADRP